MHPLEGGAGRSVFSMTQPDMLAAAARPDCDEATLVELGRISREARDFSQSLPILLRHLSFPRKTIASIGDAEWQSLEGLAASSLAPVLGSLPLLMEEHAESRPLLASAASNIWLWIGHWTRAALESFSADHDRSSKFPFSDTFLGVLELSLWNELIVLETIDVIVTLFCMGARSYELHVRVEAIMSSVNPTDPRRRGVGNDDGLLICMSRLVSPPLNRPAWRNEVFWDHIRDLSADIISYACFYIDIIEQQGTDTSYSQQMDKSVAIVLSILSQVVVRSKSALSSLPLTVYRTIVARVLGLCSRLSEQLGANLGPGVELVSMACTVRGGVFRVQSSTLNMAALVNQAADNKIISFMSTMSPDSSRNKHSDTVQATCDNIFFLLDQVMLQRMFLPAVYSDLRRLARNGTQLDTQVMDLIRRWSSDYDASLARHADRRKVICSHSQVGDFVVSETPVLTNPVSPQGFFPSRSLVLGLSGQQVLQSRLPARRMVGGQTPICVQAGDAQAS
jgi:hypothetical protein